MAKARKRVITIPRLIILALVLLLLTMGIWIFLRGALVKGLIGGITNLENQGYEITHGGLTVEGFPFKLSAASKDIFIRAPRSNAPDPAKNWSVKAANLQISSATLTPLSWKLSHTGPMRIDMRGRNGERYWFEIVPADIKARAVVSTRGTLKSARFDMVRAQLDSLVGTPPIISKIDYLDGRIKVANDIAQTSLHAEDLRLSPKIPVVLDNILGRKLALVEVNTNIDNWTLLETGGAEAWQAAGGHIKSEHWAVLWGAADMTGTFDISFKNAKPEGKIQIRIKNPEPLVGKIFQFFPEAKQYAQPVNAFISLKDTEDDGRKTINLTLKDGRVKMGFIPLPFEF